MGGFDIEWDIEKDKMAVDDEIEAAINADKNNRKIPPMPTVRMYIHKGIFNLLGVEIQRKLADFLGGEYRGKRGVKADAAFTRSVDIERFEIYLNYRETMEDKQAVDKLAAREQISSEAIQDSFLRACKYLKEEAAELERQKTHEHIEQLLWERQLMEGMELEQQLELPLWEPKDLLKEFKRSGV